MNFGALSPTKAIQTAKEKKEKAGAHISSIFNDPFRSTQDRKDNQPRESEATKNWFSAVRERSSTSTPITVSNFTETFKILNNSTNRQLRQIHKTGANPSTIKNKKDIRSRLGPLIHTPPPFTIASLNFFKYCLQRKQREEKGKVRPNPENSEEWTKVLSRKDKTNQRKKNSKSLREILAENFADLKSKRKCFNCLSKGHTKSVCKFAMKCWGCHKKGHTLSHCDLLPAEALAPISKTIHKTQSAPLSAQVTATQRSSLDPPAVDTPAINPPDPKLPDTSNSPVNTRNIIDSPALMEAPTGWQFLPMNNADEFEAHRINSLSVFFPTRDALNPDNDYLYRSAVITVNQGFPGYDFAYLTSEEVARRFGGRIEDYHVFPLDHNSGQFILICPTVCRRNQICAHGPFLFDTYELLFNRWTTRYGTAREPPVFWAKIRLEGHQLHLWNDRDLCQLVSGFGAPLDFAPHVSANNFHCVRMLVKCGHPTTIPRWLIISDDPRVARASVIIEGYARVRDFQPGPHQGPGRQWHPPPPPPAPLQPPPPPEASDNAPSRGSNSIANSGTIIQVKSTRYSNRQHSASAVNTLFLTESTDGVPLQRIDFSLVLSDFHRAVPPASTESDAFSLSMACMNTCFNTVTHSPISLFFDQNKRNSDSKLVPFESNSSEFTELDFPPGFEGPPRYPKDKHIPASPTRRSERLKAKNSGPYLTTVQRAQIAKYKAFEGNKQRKGKKNSVAVAEEYMKNKNPITVEQAEAVLLLAGLELTEATRKKLNENHIISGV